MRRWGRNIFDGGCLVLWFAIVVIWVRSYGDNPLLLAAGEEGIDRRVLACLRGTLLVSAVKEIGFPAPDEFSERWLKEHGILRTHWLGFELVWGEQPVSNFMELW